MCSRHTTTTCASVPYMYHICIGSWVVLDQKLNWSLHIEKKVSKAKKKIHLIKPAIHHIWGLDLKRMQWIYKQIILPRLTYGCLVWGHSLTNSQISKLETVESVALRYHASMWKTTPTASLQILLNQKPSHLEITNVSIKTYIRCKDMFQNNHWDGIADNISANSHLKTVKSRCHGISHEGIPLDEFHSNFMKEPHYSWNPPIRPTLTAVGKKDIDDYLHNFDDDIDNDNHDSPTPIGNDAGGLSNSNRMEVRPLRGDPTGLLSTGRALAAKPHNISWG